MPARKGTRAIRRVVQDSPLLNLPPEMRNLIYGFIASGISTVTFRQNAMTYTSAFAQACRQIREEFKSVYLIDAPRNAQQFHIHIINFRHEFADPKIPTLQHHLTASGREADRIDFASKQVRIYISLDNTFERCLPRLRELVRKERHFKIGGTVVESDHEYRISFNPATFDVNYAAKVMRREGCTWYFRYSPTWIAIEKAFGQAVDEYYAKRTTKRVKKKSSGGAKLRW
ncbi:hypothetical protein LTR56_001212 [Elasticomyces elasticus]|nr:hypothetical protein LTR56_001212 [Elasticomyces elasticus]KAK3667395.1 hypothetical protein LTR22_001572 [Elasticomyces elasticus]KAK4915248.1 hypothetical protein LTR49_016645 [Elasticomyces elasticus]KAK5760536.1 hypothetical protein LTS12_009410 [Elasticomyces elasticus]